MSELTEDERAALHRLHAVPVNPTPLDCPLCWDLVATVRGIIATRTRAVEQELTQVAEANRRRAVAAEQHLAELEAAVLALADELERTYPLRRAPWYAVELRALVSDTTALDRIRQEAVEAALAPIEALHFRRPWATALDSVTFGQTEFPDQCNCCRVPWPCLTGTFLAAARDAAGRSGGEG